MIKELISSIKEDKKEAIKESFFNAAMDNLTKKLEERKKEIAKTLFKKKESNG